MTTTLDELKGMIVAQQAEVARRLADGEAARDRQYASLDGALKGIALQVTDLTRRTQDLEERTTDVERAQQTATRDAAKALTTTTDLEGRVVRELGEVAKRLDANARERVEQTKMLEAQNHVLETQNQTLAGQDKAIADLKKETAKQTPLIEQLVKIEQDKAAVKASDDARMKRVGNWVKLAIGLATLAGIVGSALHFIH